MVAESARESGDPVGLGRRHRGLPRRESGGGAHRRKTSANIFGRCAASKIRRRILNDGQNTSDRGGLVYAEQAARDALSRLVSRPLSAASSVDSCFFVAPTITCMAGEYVELCLAREGCSMTQRIYVGNLPFDSSESDVEALFASYGSVQSCALPTDRDTGRPRGFGFVEMDPADASKAIQALNGRDFQGRSLTVSEARPRGEGGGRGGSGGGNRW